MLPPTELTTLNDNRFQVLVPINVHYNTIKNRVIAYAPLFEEYGYGSTIEEATDDLQKTIVQLYLTLKTEPKGPDLCDVWCQLRISIRETSTITP